MSQIHIKWSKSCFYLLSISESFHFLHCSQSLLFSSLVLLS